MVIVALLMVGLLGFVGLAVDVGLVFARSAELNKAVDAAALASVTEVIETANLQLAEENSPVPEQQSAGRLLAGYRHQSGRSHL
ncbi:MAG: pilus assembly protein TadG-related protein [Chloroflexi bacterium]|nr:pilus assembly protein TadG-related protein [Chloroflexota bacterium]